VWAAAVGQAVVLREVFRQTDSRFLDFLVRARFFWTLTAG
jgi:hypothetical protein